MRHVASQPDASQNKPLTEPVLLILLSLSSQPRHGYALMQDIEALSHGRVRSAPLPYMARFDGFWWTAGSSASTRKIRRAKNKAYKLTPAGRDQLQLELHRMKQLTRAATARLRTREA